MELYYTGLSDVGNVRSNNEDYYFAGKIREDEYLFIVADGMGGHKAGEVASRKAVSIFVRELEKGIGDNIPGSLKRIIFDVNERLLHEGSRSAAKNGMGTTLSVLYVKGDLGYIAHVGDSRIYRFTPPDVDADTDADTGNKFVLEQLTEDHSFVGRLLKDGYITEEEARDHPRRNVLYQSIGLKKEINIQVTEPLPIHKGQKYLLCSDGLYGVVPENEIKDSLTGGSTVDIVQHLVKKAKVNGGPDNISAIVISTQEDKTTADDTLLEDTVKIAVPTLTKRKKRKLPFFILLALLVVLLVVIIYLLITTIIDRESPLPGPGSDSGGRGQEVTDIREN